MNGLNRLNRSTGQITRYGLRNGLGNRINQITVLDDSSVWVCGDNGLARYLPETDSFRVYLPENGNPFSLNSGHVFDMIQSKSGKCYVATWHRDIQSFDPSTGRFQSIPYKRSPELNIDYRKKIIEDDRGFLWISASQHGLCRLDPKPENRFFLPPNPVN